MHTKTTNRILIVEDDEFLMLALKDNLEDEHCIIDVAHDGNEAIACIASHTPSLILLDLLMPRHDGFYVLEEVKKNPNWKSIPIIVLSNVGYDSEIKKALELGADEYFVKSQHMIVEVIMKAREYLNVHKPKRNSADMEKSEEFRILDGNGDFINSQTKLKP